MFKKQIIKIAALFFAPGVVVHELGHLFFCFLAGVRIYKVRFFQFGRTSGFVEHEEPDSLTQSILISLGPLTVNSVFSLILFSQIVPPYFYWLRLIELWLGVVIALHAIPSNGDATTLFQLTSIRVRRNPLAALGFPIVGLIYFLNILKRFHFHLIYSGLLFWVGNIYLK